MRPTTRKAEPKACLEQSSEPSNLDMFRLVNSLEGTVQLLAVMHQILLKNPTIGEIERQLASRIYDETKNVLEELSISINVEVQTW
jgi:hypothetical protein